MQAAAAGLAGTAARLPQAQHDVPAFLQRQKLLILNTGKYLNVMRECAAKPPHTLPLGTHLGEHCWLLFLGLAYTCCGMASVWAPKQSAASP